MAYLKAKEVRGLNNEDRKTRLLELRKDLMHERGVAAMGGSPPSPGKIRQLRRQIARILTISREDVLVKRDPYRARTAPKATKPAAKKAAPAKPKEA